LTRPCANWKNDSQTIQADQNRCRARLPRRPHPRRGRSQGQGRGAQAEDRIDGRRFGPAGVALDERLLELPNLPHPSVPVGKDDSENRVIREEGVKRSFASRPSRTGIRARAGASSTSTAGSRSPVHASTSSKIGARGCSGRSSASCWTCTPAATAIPKSCRPTWSGARPGGHRQSAQFRRQPVPRRDRGFLVHSTAEVPVTKPVSRRDPGGRQAAHQTRGLPPLASGANRWRLVATPAASNAATSLTKSSWSSSCARSLRWTSSRACLPTLKTCSRRWSCPTGWSRCVPAICRSRPWSSSTWNCGRPAVASAGGQLLLQLRRVPGPAGQDPFPRRSGKDPLRAHLNGSGLACPAPWSGVLETYQRADGRLDVPAVLRPYFGTRSSG